MSIPSRNSNPGSVELSSRTFFTSTKTADGRNILQSERMANLLIDVLRSYATKFKIHEFVIMPDHLHVMFTVDKEMTVEKAMQLIKGNFSYRAKKELNFQHDVWQKGYSEVRINDRQSFLNHKEYIWQNPVTAGLARVPEEWVFGSAYLRSRKHAGAEAQTV